MQLRFLFWDRAIVLLSAAPANFADRYNRLTQPDAKGLQWPMLSAFRLYFLLPLIILLPAWLRQGFTWAARHR